MPLSLTATDARVLCDPEAILFEWSVELARHRHQLARGLRDRRVDEYRGKIVDVHGSAGRITVRLDEGGTKDVALTERSATKFLQPPTTGGSGRGA
jgi:hypothetical protein